MGGEEAGMLDEQLRALGQAIRRLREERSLSTDALAAAAGVEVGQLRALEAGQLDLDYGMMLDLAVALGVEPEVLVIRAKGLTSAKAPSGSFGQRMRELRAEHGVSQDELAYRTGIHPTAIGRLERGAREPRLGTILRVVWGLGVQPGRLLDYLGERRLTPEEFQQHFGHLPTDGEG
jgi:transcriptional regulator with XRE-family HTH domain